MTKARPLKIWLINSAEQGNNSQALGVAQKLGGDIEIFQGRELEYNKLANMLEARFGPGYRHHADWPDVVIGASKTTVPTELTLKRMAKDHTFSVHLGSIDKDVAPEFDLNAAFVLPLAHEAIIRRVGDKAMFLDGVPHKVTPELIEQGKREWGSQFSGLPHPIIGVLVGGSTGLSMTELSIKDAQKFAEDVNKMAECCHGSLIVTTSRRTPEEATKAIMNKITVPCYFHDAHRSNGENPYFGLLGTADGFVVTGDSMSMACEAIATGKPVYTYPVPSAEMPNHTYFRDQLVEKRHLRKFDGTFEPWTPEPMDVAGDIAAEIRKRLEIFRSRSLG